MDFFERQELARKRTKWMVVLFALAVLAITAILYAAAIAIQGGPYWQPEILVAVLLLVTVVVGFGSLFKIAQLSKGGSVVAEMLGGQLVDLNTTDPKLRQLLNVVEEMSIASGVPVPSVYVLANDPSLNAFAAGHSTSDAVVAVTRGSLERFTREELQGVIAHEFSHILNGDMRLNIRLMGVLFGILCLAMLGQILLRFSFYTRPRSSDDKNSGAIVLALLGIGISLFVIGYIGVFFAKLIKAAVSRQREFLADASAVQFTRNPDGIASALHKIGGGGSRIESPHAEEASHMFFGNGLGDAWVSWLATHPPIEERIRAVAPRFDPASVKKIRPPEIPMDGKAAPVRRDWLGHAGAPQENHLALAASLLSSLPSTSSVAAHELHGAVALVYSLLLDPDPTVRERQWNSLQIDAQTRQETEKQAAEKPGLTHEQQITLLDLAVPTLRHLSPDQYKLFRKNVSAMISVDGKIDLFEFLLEKILVRHLDSFFSKKPPPPPQFRFVVPLLPEVSVLLAALTQLGGGTPEEQRAAYDAGTIELLVKPDDPALRKPEKVSLGDVGAALDRVASATPNVKRLILTACGQAVMHDKKVTTGEAQLLRAIADAIDCPIPPFVTATSQSPTEEQDA